MANMSKVAAASTRKMHLLDDETMFELLGGDEKAFRSLSERTVRYDLDTDTFDIKYVFEGENAVALDVDRETRLCGVALLLEGRKPKSLGLVPKPMALDAWLRRARL